MSEETVTISKSDYESLVESDIILTHLKASGVDNWEWYSVPLCAKCDKIKPDCSEVKSGWSFDLVCEDCQKEKKT